MMQYLHGTGFIISHSHKATYLLRTKATVSVCIISLLTIATRCILLITANLIFHNLAIDDVAILPS